MVSQTEVIELLRRHPFCTEIELTDAYCEENGISGHWERQKVAAYIRMKLRKLEKQNYVLRRRVSEHIFNSETDRVEWRLIE